VCVPALPQGSDGLELLPAGATTPVGQPQTLTAELRGLFGLRIAGVPITFNVTGANTVSAVKNTDVSGVASFTYTGANPGLDTIVATFAGGSSGPATVDWTGAPADTTPPSLTVPQGFTLEATSAAGAIATFGATASDDVDGPVAVNCSPDSGAAFPVGVTFVAC